VFHTMHAPTATELQALLLRIIKRLMKFLTRKGFLIEEQGMTYLADTDPDFALRPPANGGLHLPHRARASGGPESTELANRSYTRSAAYPGVLCQRARLASMPRCAAPPMSARSWSTCALHHPPRHCQRMTDTQPCRRCRATTQEPYHDGTTHVVMSGTR
jgi:hypothetical protein